MVIRIEIKVCKTDSLYYQQGMKHGMTIDLQFLAKNKMLKR